MQIKMLGELEINLCGEKKILKPTFKSLILIEQLTGRTLAALVGMFLTGKPGLNEIVGIVYGGLYGANGDSDNGLPKLEEVGAMVMSDGLSALQEPCQWIVGAAYAGKPIDQLVKEREARKASVSKEAKPEPAKQPAPLPVSST